MIYKKPGMEFWDLEEKEVIITSLGNGGNHEENGNNGDDYDFDGDKVEWF